MRPIPTLTIACATLTFFFAVGDNGLNAESPHDSTWQQQASSRLKAIYDRGEWKPRSFQPNWRSDSSSFTVRHRNPRSGRLTLWRYDVESGERVESNSPEQKRETGVSPDGKHKLESGRTRNLVARNVESGQRFQLTHRDPERDISYRHQSWSPDGKRVLFAETDRSDVKLRAMLMPSDPSYPRVRERRFARVGGKIESIRVGVVDADGENLQWLPIDAPKEGLYLGQVGWAGNSNEVLVEMLSRFRDKRDFRIIDPDAYGEVNRIYSETNEAWVVGSHGINSGLKWIDGGKAFVFISEKDGWRHAYRCSRDGEQEKKLTTGEYDIIDRAVIDEKGGWYYFYASPENATQKYLYRVPLDGSGDLQRITPADQSGTHDYEFSPDAKWAVHTFSSINSPPMVELVQLDGHRVVRVIEDNPDLRERTTEPGWQPTEFVKIDIGNDVVMDASITKPSDFDDSKKYPVFVYVYGEPHLQTVLDRWGAAQIDFLRVVADAGYVTVSIDNRGTACPKGAAWRRSVFGSLGPLSTEEQAAGLQKLAEMKPYIDLSRVGIWGWSGGGSNTLNAMFRKPDIYHVGIAVVPKPQPWLYNAWFQEIFMRTREVNAEGYQRSAPINFAEGLKGKLLIVTGSGETNTHIQIIEGLVDRLIELGKPFDYMVYPNRDHGLREGSGSVVHVRMLILRYLIENLPRGPR